MKSLLGAVLFAAIGSGCSTPQQTSSNNATAKSSPPAPTPPAQLRIGFAYRCPSDIRETKELSLELLGASIAASVGKKIITNQIDILSAYLSKEKPYKVETTTRMNGFATWDKDGAIHLNKRVQCMFVVIGREFSTSSMKKEDIIAALDKVDKPFDSYNKEAVQSATKLIGKPLLYLEAKIIPNSTESAAIGYYAFSPIKWYYPQFIGPSGWQFKNKRDVLLRIEISKPGSNATTGSFEINQGNIKPGALTNEVVVSNDYPWIPLPSDLKNAPDGTKLTDEVEIYPVNVKGLFVETSKPNTLAQYVGEALFEQKSTTARSVETQIMTSMDQGSRLESKSKSIKLASEKYDEYVKSYQAATEAADTYNSAKDAQKDIALNRFMQAKSKLAVDRALAKAALEEADIDFKDLPPISVPK